VIEEIASARTRLELAERTLDVARKQAEAERERYDLGAAIFVQVREAEEAVREADLRTTRARVDLVLAQLELDHLTGRLLERYGELLQVKPAPK
jgi:outer membrane protein TolC